MKSLSQCWSLLWSGLRFLCLDSDSLSFGNLTANWFRSSLDRFQWSSLNNRLRSSLYNRLRSSLYNRLRSSLNVFQRSPLLNLLRSLWWSGNRSGHRSGYFSVPLRSLKPGGVHWRCPPPTSTPAPASPFWDPLDLHLDLIVVLVQVLSPGGHCGSPHWWWRCSPLTTAWTCSAWLHWKVLELTICSPDCRQQNSGQDGYSSHD